MRVRSTSGWLAACLLAACGGSGGGGGGGGGGGSTSVNLGTDPRRIAVTDFDGDDDPDLVTLNEAAGTVSVLRGNGSGELVLLGTWTTGSASPRGLAVGDVSGDDRPDVVVSGSADGTVRTLLNVGGTSLAAPIASPPLPGFAPTCVALGDVIGDLQLDVVVGGTEGGGGVVRVFIGVGTGDFLPAKSTEIVGTPTDLALASLTTVDDTTTDAVVRTDASVILLSNVDEVLGVSDTVAVPSGGGRVALADLGGSTDLDVVVSDLGADSVSVLLSDGAGALDDPLTRSTGDQPLGLAAVDLDADGKADLVVAEQGTGIVRVFGGQGDGTFAPGSATTNVGASAFDVALGLFDAGASLDTGVARTGGVTLLLGG